MLRTILNVQKVKGKIRKNWEKVIFQFLDVRWK